jgi:electron transfer flavoprotein beta subunit
LATGAVKAILVSDPVLAGSDALGTAKVLAAAIARLGPDLVLAGTESTDGYVGTTPVQVAELLGWPSVSFAKHVEISDGLLRVQRQTEAGYE